MAGPGKSLAARRALVRLLARVGSAVCLETAGHRKVLATRLARERFLSCVCPHVRL